MDAYELADFIETGGENIDRKELSMMLRQQANNIGSLKARLKQLSEEIGCYKIELELHKAMIRDLEKEINKESKK
jgi:hypothetical protein